MHNIGKKKDGREKLVPGNKDNAHAKRIRCMGVGFYSSIVEFVVVVSEESFSV